MKKLHTTGILAAGLATAAFTSRAIALDPSTLFHLPFENSLVGVGGEGPVTAPDVLYEAGIVGLGARLGTGASLSYSTDENINSSVGTLEFWVRPDWNGNDGQTHVFVAWGGGGGMLFAKDGANNLRGIFNRFGFGNAPEIGVAVNVDAWVSGEWHHMAYTWSDVSKRLRLYTDGRLRDELVYTGTLPFIADSEFQIGAEGGGAFVDGIIDELRVSGVERTASEIAHSWSVGAASPPISDELSEGMAASWAGTGDPVFGNVTAQVFNDDVNVQVGAYSLRFETNAGADTWLWTPVGRRANWNLAHSGSGGIALWVYADNPSPFGFQGASPWVRIGTGPGTTDYLQYQTSFDILNSAIGQWVELVIPFTGNDLWQKFQIGNPSLHDIDWLEIHADTWESGFTLWLDGIRFDVPPSPPQDLKAFAGNGKVLLSWDPAENDLGNFSYYAVYRALQPFDDVTGRTPLVLLPDMATSGYVDATATNGVSYHYAVTTVFSDGTETIQVQSVGPRTPFDETDLQVIAIARTPRFPRYDVVYSDYEIIEPGGYGPYVFSAAVGLGSGQDASTQREPGYGDPVTYTATVRNRGTNNVSCDLLGVWRVDSSIAAQSVQSVSLTPGEMTTVSFVWPWDGQPHDIRFTLMYPDDRMGNNELSINTKSVPFLSFVDETRLEEFREETDLYPGAATNDFLDWLNLHMARFNEIFADAGTQKRVHFDVLEVLADDAPDPSINTLPFGVFPFRYRFGEGTLRLSGYYDPSEDLDFGLLHEMGHQLGLIDLYRLNLGPDQNLVNHSGYSTVECLMNGVSPFLSEHSAGAMDRWLDVAHGYFGQYLYGIPQTLRMRFVTQKGEPLSGATVRVYQKAERPGLGEFITTQVKFAGTTDADGYYTLPNIDIDQSLVPPTFAGDALQDNPFGYVAVIGTNGLLLFEVEHLGSVDYAWLDITEVNVAYWSGSTQNASFERRLSLGGPLELCPPSEDMTESNAASWAAWSEGGSIHLQNDDTLYQYGSSSLRVDTTGGFDNYVRYPGDRRARWDLANLDVIRMWVRAENDNFGFQNQSPWIRLASRDGFVEWRPAFDILDASIGHWSQLTIPAAGDALWQRTEFGSPDLTAVNHVEIHADTWGFGFTLWIDGLTFEPACSVDLADHQLFSACMTGPVGLPMLPTPAGEQCLIEHDLEGDADVDLADFAQFQRAFDP